MEKTFETKLADLDLKRKELQEFINDKISRFETENKVACMVREVDNKLEIGLAIDLKTFV